jgi:hypothetical protein
MRPNQALPPNKTAGKQARLVQITVSQPEAQDCYCTAGGLKKYRVKRETIFFIAIQINI